MYRNLEVTMVLMVVKQEGTSQITVGISTRVYLANLGQNVSLFEGVINAGPCTANV